MNYRPVTVLLSFPRSLNTSYINNWLTTSKICFRSTCSGTGNITAVPQHFSLIEQWKEDLDKHNIIGTIAIDLSKAFDCLSHDLILEKLKFYGLSDQALSLMCSYLSPRYQRVKLSDTFSTWQEVSRWVPRGSILRPTLFNIFMNDLAYAIKQCRIVNYADDTNIHCSSKDVRAFQNNLSIDLENATSWFIQNGMKPNPDKYQAMVLGKTEGKFNFKVYMTEIFLFA